MIYESKMTAHPFHNCTILSPTNMQRCRMPKQSFRIQKSLIKSCFTIVLPHILYIAPQRTVSLGWRLGWMLTDAGMNEKIHIQTDGKLNYNIYATIKLQESQFVWKCSNRWKASIPQFNKQVTHPFWSLSRKLDISRHGSHQIQRYLLPITRRQLKETKYAFTINAQERRWTTLWKS